MCLLTIGGSRRRQRGEEDGRNGGSIVGQDLSKGIDERSGLPKYMLRFVHCHIVDWGELKYYC